MVEPFAGNAATAWGTAAEPRALDQYRAVTGQSIASCMFQGGPPACGPFLIRGICFVRCLRSCERHDALAFSA